MAPAQQWALTIGTVLVLSLVCVAFLLVPAVDRAAWMLKRARRQFLGLIVIGWRIYVWRFERRIRQRDKQTIAELEKALATKETEIKLGARYAASLETQLKQERTGKDRLEATIRELRLDASIRQTTRAEPD